MQINNKEGTGHGFKPLVRNRLEVVEIGDFLPSELCDCASWEGKAGAAQAGKAERPAMREAGSAEEPHQAAECQGHGRRRPEALCNSRTAGHPLSAGWQQGCAVCCARLLILDPGLRRDDDRDDPETGTCVVLMAGTTLEPGAVPIENHLGRPFLALRARLAGPASRQFPARPGHKLRLPGFARPSAETARDTPQTSRASPARKGNPGITLRVMLEMNESACKPGSVRPKA